MIKNNKVLVKINSRNSSHYKKLGYLIDKEIWVNPIDIPHGSNTIVTAICEICNNENDILISKYYTNIDRNDKGYYSCFKCKNIEREKTCLQKYGETSYSKTDEFKNLDKSNFDYQKRVAKDKKTKLEKYGVDSWFKLDVMKEYNKKWMSSDEFKKKSKLRLIEKYGVDSYSKTADFKKFILDNKVTINEKIKETCIEKYNVDFYSKTNIWKQKYNGNIIEIREKIKDTCMERYNYENVSQVKEIQDKILNTKLIRGLIISNGLLSGWTVYKKTVRKLTNRNKIDLYKNWSGYDYYDNEYIKNYIIYKHTNISYPTIDHKVSILYGYVNNVPPEEIANISNLCITKRKINSTKNSLNEDVFKSKYIIT